MDEPTLVRALNEWIGEVGDGVAPTCGERSVAYLKKLAADFAAAGC